MEEDNHIEEVRLDGTMDVGTDTARAGSADESKAATAPTDGEEVVDLMRAQDQASVSTEENTDEPMAAMCIRAQNVPHRQLDTSPMLPLQICRMDRLTTVCEQEGCQQIEL